MSPPGPPPADGFQAVSVSSLEAVLTKLNIKVPVKDIVSAIRQEDEAKRVNLAA